jgi:hypothetical protein
MYFAMEGKLAEAAPVFAAMIKLGESTVSMLEVY